MCRLLAYAGAPIFLEDYIVTPEHSLVRQSVHADEAKVATNGDGFGLGWYTGEAARPEPGVYREVMPAWSDENLLALCASVRSRLFFAHVRAATGTAVARQNCHPFRLKNYLFMHNGQIGGYAQVRRELEALLHDDFYIARRGTTDSELIFLLAMQSLERGGSPVSAMEDALRAVRSAMQKKQIDAPLRFAAVLSDGEQMYAFRYSSDSKPPTLYMRHCNDGVIVASEPLQEDGSDCGAWKAFDHNSAMQLAGGALKESALRV
jgi:predicted glutamine amidotransferase